MNNVTVAIPNYNTSMYIESCIKYFLKSKFINEIIICDDRSEYSDVKELENLVYKLREKTDKEIVLLKNSKNIGQYENNIRLVKASSNELVYVIDADNVPQKNIDKTIKHIFSCGVTNYIYMPSKIYQFKNSYILSKLLRWIDKYYIVIFSKSNMLIDIEMVKDYFINDTKYTIDKHLMWVMGIGNFFVYKSTFIKQVPSNYGKLNNIDMTADFLAICYFYLNAGGKIYLLKNFYHFHRKRTDSAAFLLNDSFMNSIESFKKKFIDED